VLLGLGGPLWPGFTGSDWRSAGGGGLPDERAFAAHRPLLLFLSGLRRALEAQAAAHAAAPGAAPLPPAVLVTLPTWAMPLAVAAHCRAHFDAAVKLHAFGDPAYALATTRAQAAAALRGGGGVGTAREFAGDFAAMLLVRRLPAAGFGLPPQLPASLTWAVRRDRRSMALELPHLPPAGEDAAAPAPAPSPPAPSRAPQSLLPPLPAFDGDEEGAAGGGGTALAPGAACAPGAAGRRFDF
jgi:hypothetical protein